jgi:hypothetical protein
VDVTKEAILRASPYLSQRGFPERSTALKVIRLPDCRGVSKQNILVSTAEIARLNGEEGSVLTIIKNYRDRPQAFLKG